MPNKIWEMTAVVERYNTDDESLLWAECMRLLQDNPKEFLKEPISNFSEVNDGFSEAKNWLIRQGLKVTDGTLVYALQFIAYTIVLNAKDNDNKPENLTDEWLRLKKLDIKDAYSKLPSSGKGLLDILGTTIVTLGRPFDNPLAKNARDATILMLALLWVGSTIVKALDQEKYSPTYRHNDKHILSVVQWIKFINLYSMMLASLSFCGRNCGSLVYSFFNDRLRRRDAVESNYLPEPEYTLESQNSNP